MQKLNYKKLIDNNPTLYDSITNQLGQKIDFYEHPFKGDEYPVIAVYHEKEMAVCTDFYDVGDFFEGSDYNPIYKDGEIKCAFEVL